VDSFYRHSTDGAKKSEPDWKVVTQLSRGLKDLVMNVDTRLIGTHQMNRESDGKIGNLSNMALADAVGQDADLIMRVVTRQIEGKGRSAVVVLGGREVPFDGIFINNEPCNDFSELGVIKNRRTVDKWMAEEEEAEAEEEAKKFKKKGASRQSAVQLAESSDLFLKARTGVDKRTAELAEKQAEGSVAAKDVECVA